MGGLCDGVGEGCNVGVSVEFEGLVVEVLLSSEGSKVVVPGDSDCPLTLVYCTKIYLITHGKE